MNDDKKCREDLLKEVRALRQQVARLEAAENERKRAEEDRARLIAILEATPDFVGIADLDGRALYINRAGRRMVGMGEDEPATNMNVYDYHPTWVRILFSEAIPVAIRDGVWSGETALLHRDGREIPVSQVMLAHKTGHDGTVEFFSTIARDITEKKALERQRADFLAMLTHDLKNPLTSILGYLDLLAEETAGRWSGEEEDFLHRLKDNALTINSLIANFLDLATVEAGTLVLHKTLQAVGDVLRRVIEQYAAPTRRRGLTLTLDIAEELPVILGDGLALERIFANLVHNALKFTPETGRIEVSARRCTENEGVVVAVRDTGPGIAPEETPSLFEKYRRTATARHHEGTGLGLFIVKTLVEAHGGRVEVESSLGHGACFRVFLPAAGTL
ncbi:MAG: PAS domain S-box protein [Deltaproteobacteria bacterium]|nr:PAS domain S-box protein [Deltaproteobacteria bacterium]